MTLEEKIFMEIKRIKLGSNHIWIGQQQQLFRNKLNPKEYKEYPEVMHQLHTNGIFSVDENSVWRLTEKGEKTVYS